MKAYLDTNFITHLYLERPETPQAEELLRSHYPPPYPMTLLLRFEVVNAIQQYVFLSRMGQARPVTQETGLMAHASFTEDLNRGALFASPDIPTGLVDTFENIALRQTAKHGFRTYDILHISYALVLGCTTFLSFDYKARKLAQLEGFMINE